MLDKDYPTQFGELIHAVPWDIELPIQWIDYFEQRGEVPSFPSDARSNQRLKVRTHGAMWFEKSLPMCPRQGKPIGVYTKDFSRHGIGFLSPVELYPEECVRLVLPTFWTRLRVMRARRITSHCYEIGTLLMGRHDPDVAAFADTADELASC